MLCGQRVSSTVRGRPVAEQSEEFINLYMKASDDEGYNAAREERLRLERAVKLETYQERKLEEKIKTLEMMRIAEIEHQEEIRKREARRLARKEDLEKQMQELWVDKLAKEKEEEELEKQKKAKQAEAEKRLKRYQDKQKEILSEWYRSKASEETPAEKVERLAREKEKDREKERAAREKLRTVKQSLTDEKVQRLLQAVEQRPPVPPRQHDLPRPLLELSEDSSEKRAQSARSRPASWTAQAKAVSASYGLSAREEKDIESRMKRGVYGAGRMAGYDSN
jgi:hypothetical protein